MRKMCIGTGSAALALVMSAGLAQAQAVKTDANATATSRVAPATAERGLNVKPGASELSELFPGFALPTLNAPKTQAETQFNPRAAIAGQVVSELSARQPLSGRTISRLVDVIGPAQGSGALPGSPFSGGDTQNITGMVSPGLGTFAEYPEINQPLFVPFGDKGDGAFLTTGSVQFGGFFSNDGVIFNGTFDGGQFGVSVNNSVEDLFTFEVTEPVRLSAISNRNTFDPPPIDSDSDPRTGTGIALYLLDNTAETFTQGDLLDPVFGDGSGDTSTLYAGTNITSGSAVERFFLMRSEVPFLNGDFFDGTGLPDSVRTLTGRNVFLPGHTYTMSIEEQGAQVGITSIIVDYLAGVNNDGMYDFDLSAETVSIASPGDSSVGMDDVDAQAGFIGLGSPDAPTTFSVFANLGSSNTGLEDLSYGVSSSAFPDAAVDFVPDLATLPAPDGSPAFDNTAIYYVDREDERRPMNMDGTFPPADPQDLDGDGSVTEIESVRFRDQLNEGADVIIEFFPAQDSTVTIETQVLDSLSDDAIGDVNVFLLGSLDADEMSDPYADSFPFVDSTLRGTVMTDTLGSGAAIFRYGADGGNFVRGAIQRGLPFRGFNNDLDGDGGPFGAFLGDYQPGETSARGGLAVLPAEQPAYLVLDFDPSDPNNIEDLNGNDRVDPGEPLIEALAASFDITLTPVPNPQIQPGEATDLGTVANDGPVQIDLTGLDSAGRRQSVGLFLGAPGDVGATQGTTPFAGELQLPQLIGTSFISNFPDGDFDPLTAEAIDIGVGLLPNTTYTVAIANDAFTIDEDSDQFGTGEITVNPDLPDGTGIGDAELLNFTNARLVTDTSRANRDPADASIPFLFDTVGGSYADNEAIGRPDAFSGTVSIGGVSQSVNVDDGGRAVLTFTTGPELNTPTVPPENDLGSLDATLTRSDALAGFPSPETIADFERDFPTGDDFAGVVLDFCDSGVDFVNIPVWDAATGNLINQTLIPGDDPGTPEDESICPGNPDLSPTAVTLAPGDYIAALSDGDFRAMDNFTLVEYDIAGDGAESAAEFFSFTVEADTGPQPCLPADLAEPFGLLDGADVNAFITAFGGGDAAADLNDDGVVDGADVNSFITQFGAGCP